MGTTDARAEVAEGQRVPPVRPRAPQRADTVTTVSDLRAWLSGVRNRHPAVGLAAGVVRRGSPAVLAEEGVADLRTSSPVDEGTVFRIGSVTKVVTALAVLRLHEQGAVELDAPATEYLHSYPVVLTRPGLALPTLRHLLTHTAGIAEVQRLRDLVRPGAGPFGSRPAMPSVPAGGRLPTLAEFYRRGLPVVAQPGEAFAYTNHGYATLGQVVEDVSGVDLGEYLREQVLHPLGMEDTGLERPARPMSPHVATGYVVGRHGAEAVPDRDWLGAGSGGLWSTPRDLARLAAALLGGDAVDDAVVSPRTLATMFAAHHRPDPRLPGWGLGVARRDLGGHPAVGHDGVLPGFHSAVLAAPDDGVAVFALTNGSPGAFVWLGAELEELLRDLLDAPDTGIRTDVPQRPDTWAGLCGTYGLPPRVSDLRGRVALTGGVQVLVQGGRLVVRARAPVPALRRGTPLHPDDGRDPDVFRLDLTALGMPNVRVVAQRDALGRAVALHADLGGQPLTLVRTG